MSARGRVGVVVLDHGRPADAACAAASAHDPRIDPRILIVENGTRRAGAGGSGWAYLSLPRNLGFGAGMNAGVERLRRDGCDRFLLLNNDAVLEPGSLALLADVLDDRAYAGVGPVILDATGATVESRGLSVGLLSGRVRLVGHGRAAGRRIGLGPADALSGAALMLSLHAIERVGPLDSDYFYGFEDVDWCLRAREAGLRLAVAYDARARHAGSATLGRSSPERIYYATRNHLRCFDRRRSLHGPTGSLRAAAILGWNFAFALRQPGPLRWAAVRAVWEGLHDARLGRWGPRVNGGVRQRID